MVDVKANHLCGPARGTAALDGVGIAVEAAQETHDAARNTASREPLALSAKRAEGAGARPALEELGLRHIFIRDRVLAQQLVLDAHDEARTRLGSGVLVDRFDDLTALRVYVIHFLRFAGYTIRALEPGVEPLRGIRGKPLVQDEVNELVVQYLRLLAFLDHAFLYERGNPEIDHAMRHLAERHLMLGAGNAGPAKILGRDDVHRILGIVHGKLKIAHLAERLARFVVRKKHVALRPVKQVVDGFPGILGPLEIACEPAAYELVNRGRHGYSSLS